ncbi:hypothetical protein KFK09_018956 [Dendrobium nobile]|uniref:Pentatricopeptide repeat-containing protein n=1 Tax=Dendrobium nobile TaxID=94219 RepID=A0A8T3AX91_DENNO|nr:hypothetical protein KFK09_018956 [Dendrobium nobile]
MPETDLITCNIMLAGYVKNGSFAEALNLFHNMRTQANLAPDATTIAIVLSAISELSRIRNGIAVHEYINGTIFLSMGSLVLPSLTCTPNAANWKMLCWFLSPRVIQWITGMLS